MYLIFCKEFSSTVIANFFSITCQLLSTNELSTYVLFPAYFHYLTKNILMSKSQLIQNININIKMLLKINCNCNGNGWKVIVIVIILDFFCWTVIVIEKSNWPQAWKQFAKRFSLLYPKRILKKNNQMWPQTCSVQIIC